MRRRHKKYSWLVFNDDDFIFHCLRCGHGGALPKDVVLSGNAVKEAQKFTDEHKDCKVPTN